ncbi:uncharacterized protein LOC128230453 isoform X2 [Mya arenaria]|uniref:uncharacterized protein LOC128230453 isoform X2 n=1 Tax=Mya arenaria TaxID=6604 RepID=UPI0022E98F90|nr:uncharacterized protein LOC128230453 isoform X2 [Mya arenaria]
MASGKHPSDEDTNDQEITQGTESPQSDSSTGHNCSPNTRMHPCHRVFDITAVDRFLAMQPSWLLKPQRYFQGQEPMLIKTWSSDGIPYLFL